MINAAISFAEVTNIKTEHGNVSLQDPNEHIKKQYDVRISKGIN